MPVSYDLDPDLRLIRTRCSAGTTLAEVLGHFEELRSNPSLPQILDVHLDLAEMTSLPTLEQLEIAAATTGRLTPRLRWGALAIVVGTEPGLAASRVYEALISYYFEDISIFRDEAEADVWLQGVRERRVRRRDGPL